MELVNPGLGLIFWMSLAFLAILFILKKYAWSPILTALKERESSIDEALHAADKARDEMKQLKFSNEQLMKEAKNERDAILTEARKIKDSIIEESRIIHCAACLWNCAYAREEGCDLTNVDFRAGSGGLHSNIN